MTVAQLIAAPKDLPPDARVIVGHDDVAWDAEPATAVHRICGGRSIPRSQPLLEVVG